MGSCISAQNTQQNIFLVKIINESKHLVQKGHLEVTLSDLIYTDDNTNDKWNWPLRYLRKYGCEGEVFSFEAGRKCPGGEGLYAFASKHANKIFELVARNINQGEHLLNGELSPFPSETTPPDLATMSFNRPNSPPVKESNYTNIGPTGLPLVDEEFGVPHPDMLDTEPLNGLPPKGQYREVVFQRPPEEHPLPEQNPKINSSYSKIDFEQTEKLTKERIQGTLLDDPNSYRTAEGPRMPPMSRGKHHHRRLNTVSSHHRHSSESSFSSQSSLTESSRNISNGHASHPIIEKGPSTGGGVTYENLGNQPPIGILYQNVNLGSGVVNEVFSPTATETQYANVECSRAMRRQTHTSSNSVVTPIRVDGTGTYADVDHSFRNRATSTPVSKEQPSYLLLTFSKDQGTPGQSMDEQAVQLQPSCVPQPSLSAQTPQSPDVSLITSHPDVSLITSRPEDHLAPLLSPPSSSDLQVIDETKVAYGTLNFPIMEALSETSRDRQQEIDKNQHERLEIQEPQRSRKISSSHEKSSKKRL